MKKTRTVFLAVCLLACLCLAQPAQAAEGTVTKVQELVRNRQNSIRAAMEARKMQAEAEEAAAAAETDAAEAAEAAENDAAEAAEAAEAKAEEAEEAEITEEEPDVALRSGFKPDKKASWNAAGSSIDIEPGEIGMSGFGGLNLDSLELPLDMMEEIKTEAEETQPGK